MGSKSANDFIHSYAGAAVGRGINALASDSPFEKKHPIPRTVPAR